MQLSAYHDGELDQAARLQVESHLQQCPKCRCRLEDIRKLSSLFADAPTESTEVPSRRFHRAIEQEADRPILRLGGAVAAIAASIIIVGLAWLHELPAPTRQPGITRTSPARMEDWEPVAFTLRVPPRLRSGPGSDRELAELDLMQYMVLDLGTEPHR